jgi:heptosyltransferase-2
MKSTVNNLVVFAPNWLGDAVMSLPAIADLRRSTRDMSITITARDNIAPLFRMVPDINDVVVFEKRGRTPFSERVSEKGIRPLFDAALLLPNSFRSALVASRAGIPERWGYRTDWRRPLLTRAIDPPAGLHQVEYYQQLVHALGCPNGPMEPRLSVSAELRESGVRALTDAGWNGRRPLVALAPGAAYGGAKRWPPNAFAELADTLAADGVQPVMVGSRADEPVGRAVEAALARRDAMLNLMGGDVATLAGILAACRALVSNDSGAMHVAAAIGISVTAVFGPTDERATRPIGDAHTVLTHPVWCRPCMLRECPLDHRCMRGVSVEAVAGAARRLL